MVIIPLWVYEAKMMAFKSLNIPGSVKPISTQISKLKRNLKNNKSLS